MSDPAGDTSEFWEDPGPGFSPDAAPEAPDTDALPVEDVGWTPEGVADFLRSIQAPAFNATLNPLLGVADVDWTHREARLAQVAPAIAREWNKIPHVKALAGQTDRGIILSYVALEYLGPRAFEVVQERRARAEEEEQEFLEHDEPMFDQPAAPVSDINDAGPRVTGLPPRRR